MSDAAVGRGLVKSVSSGDTLIVRAIGGGAAPTGPCLPRAAPAAGAPFKAFVPAAEFSLTLAHLQAPRLARANSEVGDDAGAWPSREVRAMPPPRAAAAAYRAPRARALALALRAPLARARARLAVLPAPAAGAARDAHRPGRQVQDRLQGAAACPSPRRSARASRARLATAATPSPSLSPPRAPCHAQRSSEKGERSYAAVWLDGASESVNAVVARAGWAKVILSRDDKRCDVSGPRRRRARARTPRRAVRLPLARVVSAPRPDCNALSPSFNAQDYETLVELSKAAEAAKVGIFSPEAAPRKLVWALPAESAPAVAAALGSCQVRRSHAPPPTRSCARARASPPTPARVLRPPFSRPPPARRPWSKP